MIDRIKALLGGGAQNHKTDELANRKDNGDLQLAAAALLVEAASLDGHFDDDERSKIASLLEVHFGLNEDEVQTLIESAVFATDKASQLYGFTRVIKDRFEHEERVQMVEMLWEVAYADGQLDDFEANLVRRVCGLIYVPDRESGEARKRVLARMT